LVAAASTDLVVAALATIIILNTGWVRDLPPGG
jgi:hypothetical protein